MYLKVPGHGSLLFTSLVSAAILQERRPSQTFFIRFKGD